jgi:hypothetical protein
MSKPRPKSDPPAVKYEEPHFTFRVLGRARPTHKPNCRTPFGYCWKGYGDIHVDCRQSEEEMIDTVVHELIHDVMPYLDEEAVEKSANIIAKAMWQLGYRRTLK